MALSNPFTYYFLGFINFFTISSHYILLNMPIPEALYNHLSAFYQQVNSNVIGRFWKLAYSAPTQEMVNRSKSSTLGLTSDLATGQLANFLMSVGNIILFQGINYLLTKLRKNSALRRILYQPLSEIVLGQYVALFMPLTAPWVFFMYDNGVSSTLGKLNLTLQYLFFGANLIFVLHYMFHLLDSQNSANAQSCPQKKHPPKTIKALDKASIDLRVV